MNGIKGKIDLAAIGMSALVTMDSKGRLVIPYKIRKGRSTKFGLYVTDKGIFLQYLK